MFGDQYGEFVCVYSTWGLKGKVLSPSSHTPIQAHTHSLTLLWNDPVFYFFQGPLILLHTVLVNMHCTYVFQVYKDLCLFSVVYTLCTLMFESVWLVLFFLSIFTGKNWMDLYFFPEMVISPAKFANYKCTYKTEPNCS